MLVSDKKGYNAGMQIEGRNPIIEALRSKLWVNKVIVQQDIKVDAKISEILKRAHNRGVYIERRPRKMLDKISQTHSHQGVIAQVQFDYADLQAIIDENNTHQKANFFIYIREALYEDNIGAIARSAEAAGFTGIILTPKTAISAQSFRTSMGALSNIKVIKESLFTAIKIAKDNGIKVVGIERNDQYNYHTSDLSGPIMLIIGGEDKSLSSEVMNKCDFTVNIPMRGKINSLNMSVAAAVVIFEKMRQELVAGR